MSRRRRTAKRPANYVDDSDSAEDFDEFVVSRILSIFAPQRATRTRKSTPKKRNLPCQCDGQHCGSKAKKQPKQQKTKKSKTKSTTTVPPASINLDSDSEVPNSALTQTYEADIQNKLDHIFKGLESNDESEEETRENKVSFTSSSEPKPIAFYSIVSDSEGEDENHAVDKSNFKVSSFPHEEQLAPSTSSMKVSNVTDENLNLQPKKNAADLLSYVDDILNECDVVDLDPSSKTSSTLSLDDLKKNANRILNDVRSFAEGMQPKEPEKTNPATPVKEVPPCPVCLENLGGGKQAVATLCGHIFCRQCLDNVMKTTKKCPSCRVRLNKSKYHTIYL